MAALFNPFLTTNEKCYCNQVSSLCVLSSLSLSLSNSASSLRSFYSLFRRFLFLMIKL